MDVALVGGLGAAAPRPGYFAAVRQRAPSVARGSVSLHGAVAPVGVAGRNEVSDYAPMANLLIGFGSTLQTFAVCCVAD